MKDRHPEDLNRKGTAAELRELRAALKEDRHRPLYHFVAPANWMNDPNGCFFWKGQYHLFYQYNPDGPFWGNIHWGHARSSDLVHWEDCPVALTPSANGPDKSGCWSGSVVDNDGTPTAFYTGIEPQTVCVATGSDDLMSWKQVGTPVVSEAPTDLELTGFPSITGHPSADFRDPFVWKESTRWYLLIGAGLREKGGTALLYDSTDLRDWRYLGPILTGVIGPNCNMWECPVLLRFGTRRVLLVCPHPEAKSVYWITGDWRDDVLHERRQGQLDLGSYVYAPQCLHDPDHDRYLLWTWIKEARTAGAQRSAGWSGSLSLPKECSLGEDGYLILKPAAELASLRKQHRSLANGELTSSSADPLLGFVSDCCEIEVEMSFDRPSVCDFYLRSSPGLAEYTLVTYDSTEESLTVDCTRSSLSTDVEREVVSGALPADRQGKVRLRMFLDRSILEIFLADSACITQRIYPTREDSLTLAFKVRTGSVVVHKLAAWKLASIWTS
jgi:beta-fructofuranosidase